MKKSTHKMLWLMSLVLLIVNVLYLIYDYTSLGFYIHSFRSVNFRSLLLLAQFGLSLILFLVLYITYRKRKY